MEATIHHALLTLASSLEGVDAVEQLARSFALLAGFDEHVVSDIALATREATVNAIIHGNQQHPGKAISAELDLTAEELVIRITDQGEGFQPEEVPDPLHEDNLLRSSGRGVFLMRQTMDDVHFSKHNTGSTITLRKHRT
ncbi:ATP-binding protein [Terriglobus aquaticus]|nr:ATP-binding protein [Terriglobus aquaticus]